MNNYVPHEWQLDEIKYYDKSEGFDPKTTPIADYWKKYTCFFCDAFRTEIGYLNEGSECTYGSDYTFTSCTRPPGESWKRNE